MRLLYLLAFLALSMTCLPAGAEQYFVDYAGGDDSAKGTSPTSAWKHAPGDANATGNAAAVGLEPGDMVVFKGGVQYRGELRIASSGSAGRPIVLDGNTAGTFGQGQAIFDGAKTISSWQAVTSAQQVGGNPLWKKIVYADLDVDLSSNFDQGFVLHRDGNANRQAPWQRLFLVDGQRQVLPIAQRPKPTDTFYPDLPADFWSSPHPLDSSYPHKLYYEKGTRGNSSLPLIAITYGGSAPVIEPFDGGAVSVEMTDAKQIAQVGVKLFRPKSTPAAEQVAILIDDEQVFVAKMDTTTSEMQRFMLPKPIKGRKITFQLRPKGSDLPRWTKLQQIAAFTPEGENLIEHEVSTFLEDPQRLTQDDPHWYDSMFVGVHGGNNHVYFSRVQKYEPQASRLTLPHFSARTYDNTKWAIYNAPKLIDNPGEWCVVPLAGGRSRVFLLPQGDAGGGPPTDVGYPVLSTAVSISGDVSHIEVRGFLMQRYAGGKGGVATNAIGKARPSHIRVADCEIRFLSGQSGVSFNHSDHVVMENCYIHHNPGWTVGTYINRVNDYKLINNRIDTNSGSGIRHYEAKRGELRGNAVLNHYGMHSSGLNFYEGCEDILFENNYVQNVIAINRNAKRLVLRNNVIDSQGRSAFNIAMWQSGRVGGRDITDVRIEGNTLVNLGDASWATSIFVQGNASPPTGLVVRNNVLDRLSKQMPGTVQGNVLVQTSKEGAAQPSGLPEALFRDPAADDYRRKPDSPNPKAGADIPPPPDAWQLRR
jgi:hypothetical protein